LHGAAATGDLEAIELLHQEHAHLIDSRIATKDTPLLVAAAYGQSRSVLRLLELGADASMTNDHEENILHYLWCFTLDVAQTIARKSFLSGARLDQEARARPFDDSIDLLPLVSGTPVERLAGRNRVDLVTMLILDFGAVIGHYRNGNQLRRMLQLAMCLQNVDMQRSLIDFASDSPSEADAALNPIYQTEEASFVSEAATGRIAGVRFGIDAPFDFAIACRHGSHWRDVLDLSIANAIQLYPNLKSREEQVSSALLLSFKESNLVAFKTLLRVKLFLTTACDASDERLHSLKPLAWKVFSRIPGNGEDIMALYAFLSEPCAKLWLTDMQ